MRRGRRRRHRSDKMTMRMAAQVIAVSTRSTTVAMEFIVAG
jgi:hypothetical protein